MSWCKPSGPKKDRERKKKEWEKAIRYYDMWEDYALAEIKRVEGINCYPVCPSG